MPPYKLKTQGTDIANDKTYNSEMDTACVSSFFFFSIHDSIDSDSCRFEQQLQESSRGFTSQHNPSSTIQLTISYIKYAGNTWRWAILAKTSSCEVAGTINSDLTQPQST